MTQKENTQRTSEALSPDSMLRAREGAGRVYERIFTLYFTMEYLHHHHSLGQETHGIKQASWRDLLGHHHYNLML